MGEKRIIQEPHVNEVYDGDYIAKDSTQEGTSAILASDFKSWINSGMATESDLEDAIANFASEYSTSTSYAVGGFCIFDGVLYECIGATTGDWDSTKWTAITVGDKLISLDSDISTLLRDIISNGYAWSSTTHYAKNSIVIYNKAIYKCAVDNPTVGTFVDNEWFKTSVKSLIDDVEEMICGKYQPSSVGMTHKYYVGDLVWIYENYKKVIYIANTENQDSSWTASHWDKVTDISGLSKYLMDKIAEAGQIDDVQVKTTGDYESVVDENKVAKIDLSNILIKKSVPNLPQSVATFNDGSDLPLKSLTASIVPVQDLHGYDSPWVGGAGKNKLPCPIAETKTSGSLSVATDGKGNFTVNGSTDSSAVEILFDLPEDFTIPTSVDAGGNGCLYLFNPSTSNNILVTLYYDNTAVETWACNLVNRKSSSYVNMGGQTINKVGVRVLANASLSSFKVSPMFTADGTSSETAFAPYSNICPISGWTEEVVTVASDNLFNEQYPDIDSTTRKIILEVGDGNFTLSTTTPLYDTGTTQASNLFLQTGEGEESASTQNDGVWLGHDKTVASTNGKVTIKYRCYLNNTAYSPVNFETSLTKRNVYTIPFTDGQGQSVEVFGGSVDVVNGGEQPRTLGKIIVDENTDVKVYGGWRFYFDVPNFVSPAYNVVANIQCDRLTAKAKNSMPNTNSISAYDTGGARMIISVNDTITTVEDMKAWLANNPLEIVYELATPTTFHTQPTSIKSLDGDNNVWASTGDVTQLEYIANATDVIANLEARVTALENQ